MVVAADAVCANGGIFYGMGVMKIHQYTSHEFHNEVNNPEADKFIQVKVDCDGDAKIHIGDSEVLGFFNKHNAETLIAVLKRALPVMR